jgi:hypothetical protein
MISLSTDISSNNLIVLHAAIVRSVISTFWAFVSTLVFNAVIRLYIEKFYGNFSRDMAVYSSGTLFDEDRPYTSIVRETGGLEKNVDAVRASSAVVGVYTSPFSLRSTFTMNPP